MRGIETDQNKQDIAGQNHMVERSIGPVKQHYWCLGLLYIHTYIYDYKYEYNLVCKISEYVCIYIYMDI